MRDAPPFDGDAKWRSVPAVAAYPWARECLQQGSPVARILGDSLERFTKAELLVPRDWAGVVDPIDDASRGIRIADMAGLVDRRLAPLVPEDAVILIEDTLRQPGDGILTGEHVVAGETVQHIARSAAGSWAVISRWTSWYSLIVLIVDTTDLGLGMSGALGPADMERLAQRTVGLLVGVFDGETVLALHDEYPTTGKGAS